MFKRKNKNIINRVIHLSSLLFLNGKGIEKGKKDIKTINRNNNINKKENLNKRQLMTRNYFFLNNIEKLNKTNYLIIILYLNLFFNNNLTTEKAILLNSSNITIKINNSGTQKIFEEINDWYGKTIFTRPDEVYINGIRQNQVQNQYYLNRTENYIKLVWNNTISNCNCLFKDCKTIISVDFSNFDFSQGLAANALFYNCELLTSINLYDFGIIKIIDAGSMFYNCASLTSLNLSNFNVTETEDIGNMFTGCKSLTSLDLSNFITLKVTQTGEIFFDCLNLEYINLKNAYFDPSNGKDLLKDVKKNIVFCTNDSRIKQKVQNYECIVFDCSDNWREKQKKINPDNNQCVDNCSLTNYKYDYKSNCYTSCPNRTYNNNYICEDCHPDCKTCYNTPEKDYANCLSCLSSDKFLQLGNCVSNCPKGYYNDEKDNSIKICKCELDKCDKCSKESFIKNLCITCNEKYYPKYNDTNNDNLFIDCYKSPEGYYLDKNNNEPFYKPCYESCKTCNVSGNETYHNCSECKLNYFELNFQHSKNCYENCTFYHYLEHKTNIYYCTESFECPENYNKLIYDKKECIDKCDEDDEYIYEFKNICYKQCPQGSIKAEKNRTSNKYFCEPLCAEENPFLDISTQECVKSCSIKDFLQKLCKLNYKNEINNTKNRNDLDKLLDNIEILFTSDGFNTSNLDNGNDEIITYEKLIITLTTSQNQRNNTNNSLTKIDLGNCETLLRKEYNISENETLYMKKIDVIQEGMKIPKIEYDVYSKLNGTKLIKLNISVCENSKVSLSIPIEITENLDKFNRSSEYFKNICYKATSDSDTDMLLDDRKTEFVEGNKTVCQEDCDFADYNSNDKLVNCSCKAKESSSSVNDMNINKTKLYENFEDTNNKDISNLEITSCNILGSTENIESNAGFYLLLIILVIFIIIFIIFYTKGYNLLEDKIDETINKRFKDDINNKKNKTNKIKIFFPNEDNFPSKQRKKNRSKSQRNKRLPSKKNKSNNLFLNKKSEKGNNISKEIPPKKNNKNKISNKTEVQNIKPDTDYELNWLSYKEAIKYDKRSNCEYYGSLIRSKQLFAFTFCSFNDYNSGVIKKFMFFLLFALHYTVNALFFTDSNIHKIYEDGGKYDFSYQLPYIIYSAVIATVTLRLMLQFLVLTDKDILQIKLQYTKNLAINMKEKKLKCMKIKFAIFFILNFILLGFFWYYLTCFNAIFQNTQIYLIENTFISFALSLFYPFIINIFPIMIRMASIHSKNKDQQYLYKFSQIIQLI